MEKVALKWVFSPTSEFFSACGSSVNREMMVCGLFGVCSSWKTAHPPHRSDKTVTVVVRLLPFV